MTTLAAAKMGFLAWGSLWLWVKWRARFRGDA